MQAESLGELLGGSEAVIIAKVSTGVTLQLTLTRDFGDKSQTATVSLTAAGSETRVVRRIPGSTITDAMVLQTRIGDASAVASAWVVDELLLPISQNQKKTM